MYKERNGRPGGAAGGQAAMAGGVAPVAEAQSWPRRSALFLLATAQTACNHFAQFDPIAAPLPLRAPASVNES